MLRGRLVVGLWSAATPLLSKRTRNYAVPFAVHGEMISWCLWKISFQSLFDCLGSALAVVPPALYDPKCGDCWFVFEHSSDSVMHIRHSVCVCVCVWWRSTCGPRKNNACGLTFKADGLIQCQVEFFLWNCESVQKMDGASRHPRGVSLSMSHLCVWVAANDWWIPILWKESEASPFLPSAQRLSGKVCTSTLSTHQVCKNHSQQICIYNICVCVYARRLVVEISNENCYTYAHTRTRTHSQVMLILGERSNEFCQWLMVLFWWWTLTKLVSFLSLSVPLSLT